MVKLKKKQQHFYSDFQNPSESAAIACVAQTFCSPQMRQAPKDKRVSIVDLAELIPLGFQTPNTDYLASIILY